MNKIDYLNILKTNFKANAEKLQESDEFYFQQELGPQAHIVYSQLIVRSCGPCYKPTPYTTPISRSKPNRAFTIYLITSAFTIHLITWDLLFT